MNDREAFDNRRSLEEQDAQIKRLCDGLLAASDIQTMGPKPGRVKRYRAGLRLARKLADKAGAN